jgi:hypothetical protein
LVPFKTGSLLRIPGKIHYSSLQGLLGILRRLSGLKGTRSLWLGLGLSGQKWRCTEPISAIMQSRLSISEGRSVHSVDNLMPGRGKWQILQRTQRNPGQKRVVGRLRKRTEQSRVYACPWEILFGGLWQFMAPGGDFYGFLDGSIFFWIFFLFLG